MGTPVIRFQWFLVGGEQWCCWFQCRHGVVSGARQCSPGGAVSSRKCEKVRPVRSKWPQFGVFALAGRVFSRRCRWRGCAGRASSRQLALRWSWMRCGALQGGCGWGGVCAMRSPLAACRRRVGGLDGVIPPCGGEATSRGGVAAKVQTHWAKNAENRLFEVNGSALWRIWRVWTHRLRYSALQAR